MTTLSRAALRFGPALVLLIANVAHAGPVERMADLALHPTNPDMMVMRYVNGGTGLVYTSDGGKTFKLLCAAAIDLNKPNGATAITSEGHVLIGTFDGLWEDDGHGCNWKTVDSLKGRWITDLVTDPTNPMRMLGVSGNGGAGIRNGLSELKGTEPWADLGTRDELGITRVRAVKNGSSMRLYQSALRVAMGMDGMTPEAKYLIRVSDDQGQTWKESEVPVMNGSLRLEAIDPTNPDRVIASVARENMPDDILVSSDQGKTFKTYLTVSDFGGIAFAPDGRVWIGEPASISSAEASRGLWYAANLDAPATKVAEYGVECLAYQPANETLFGCQAYTFGKIDLTTWAFSESFHFRTAKEFVSCEGVDIAQKCQAQMCADYCGPAHFAQAPICCAYTTTSCGPLVAETEGTGSQAMCIGSGSSAGTSGSNMSGSGASAGTTGGSAAAGSSGSTTGSMDSAGKAGSAGTSAGPEGPKKGDDGCSCRVPGSNERDAGGLWSLALFALFFASRRVGRKQRR
jgi:hypothetical protein